MESTNSLISTENYFSANRTNEFITKPILPIHTQILNKLLNFLKTKKVPNLLFHGSSGSGKRTLVNTFINDIYKDDKYRIKQNVMHVNCSHGKGIKFIREELKFFAKRNIQSDEGSNFKTIVLLNADHLTIDAQSALRRCIELFSYNTRFFIIVENKHKLLNPILSRFCEIYVPEYIDRGNIMNLHRKMNNMSENTCPTENSWLSMKINELDETVVTHSDLIELSNEIYQKGFSCLDLIYWIQDNNNIDELLKSSVVIYYDKIKLEYRSEPLLIFVLLDYLYMRENKEINF